MHTQRLVQGGSCNAKLWFGGVSEGPSMSSPVWKTLVNDNYHEQFDRTVRFAGLQN